MFPYICDAAWSIFSHIGVIPSSCTFVLRLTSLTLPLVLATSSTLRRNNGANCFASVQRKLVLTGARAMIHTLDLRDARVRVAGARFTLPTSLDEKSNSPEIWEIRIQFQFNNYLLFLPQLLNPREMMNFVCSSSYCQNF